MAQPGVLLRTVQAVVRALTTVYEADSGVVAGGGTVDVVAAHSLGAQPALVLGMLRDGSGARAFSWSAVPSASDVTVQFRNGAAGNGQAVLRFVLVPAIS